MVNAAFSAFLRYHEPMARIRLFACIVAAAACSSAPARACAPLSVFFDWGSTRLSDPSQAALERLAVSVAWKSPDLAHILLTAHTDTTGSPEANRRIALRRAQAVRDVLVGYNVPRQLIRIQPLGAAAPRVATAANVREPRNRRVELIVQMSAEAQAQRLRDGRPIC